MSERDYDSIRKSIFRRYSPEEMAHIAKLFQNQTFASRELKREGTDLRAIIDNFFGDLIYSSKSKNGTFSPMELLMDDESLKTAFAYIDAHPNFYKKSDVTNLKSFLRNSSKVGKVSNFDASIARKIYETYLPNGGNVLDYSCGFGKRMSGALLSKNKYYYFGIEPAQELYRRLLKYLSWLLKYVDEEISANIYNVGSEIPIRDLEDKIDLSFSSPPYFDYERYNDEETQCYNRFKTYSSWLEGYVLPTLLNIYSYTKDGGLHLVNLQNIGGHTLIEDWTMLCEKIGFKILEERELKTLRRKNAKSKSKLLVYTKT